jgi:hypothetical protein
VHKWKTKWKKKRLNPSGESESGILKSAWGRTGRRTCKEQEALEDEQGSKECVVLFQSGTQRQQSAKGQRSEQKTRKTQSKKGCVTDTVALPFRLKSILRQKKNYENSNISPSKNNIIFKKKIL